ncbi:sulfite exporter TauE/SafE family protein [bacterium]|nr:sulfite exporter TauE/SafE family protein [bacterium]
MEPHVDAVLIKDSEYGSKSINIKEKSLKEIWTFKRRDLIIYFSAISIWIICLSLFGDFWFEVKNFWYFIPFGILGATVAMSTPAGGGLVFFPVLIRLGFSTHEVVAFTLATETIGMGFGSIRWMLEDFKAFQWKVVCSSIPGGWVGMYIGTLHAPLKDERIARLLFSFVGLSLCILTLYAYYRKGEGDNSLKIKPMHFLSFFLVGIIGGFITSYIGFGVDLYIFFFMVLFCGYTLHAGTVSSIIIIASTVPLGFYLHAHFLNTIRWEFWQMVIPGVLTGAIIGPKVLLSIGSKKMMYMLTVLLSLEFIATVFFRK